MSKILRSTIPRSATIRGHAPAVIRVRNVHRERVDNPSLLGRALLDQRCTAFAPSFMKSGHVETRWSFISRIALEFQNRPALTMKLAIPEGRGLYNERHAIRDYR